MLCWAAVGFSFRDRGNALVPLTLADHFSSVDCRRSMLAISEFCILSQIVGEGVDESILRFRFWPVFVILLALESSCRIPSKVFHSLTAASSAA